MKVEERSFAALLSPYDIRDYKFIADTTVELPQTFELPSVSVKNQGSVGSCVAHACSSLVEYHNKCQEHTNTIFSTEFIYGYRPEGYYIGEGMYIREALKTLQKVGDCPLTALRGNNKCPKAMKNVNSRFDELKELAYPHRISTYMLVKGQTAMKQALMQNGYLIISMPWYKDYKLKDGVYTYTSTEKSGNHAVVIYGWNENGWLVHNSWGKGWGKKGKFILPFDFKLNEVWSVTDNIVNNDIDKPGNKWYVKAFGKLINFVVNLFRKKQ